MEYRQLKRFTYSLPKFMCSYIKREVRYIKYIEN